MKTLSLHFFLIVLAQTTSHSVFATDNYNPYQTPRSLNAIQDYRRCGVAFLNTTQPTNSDTDPASIRYLKTYHSNKSSTQSPPKTQNEMLIRIILKDKGTVKDVIHREGEENILFVVEEPKGLIGRKCLNYCNAALTLIFLTPAIRKLTDESFINEIAGNPLTILMYLPMYAFPIMNFISLHHIQNIHIESAVKRVAKIELSKVLEKLKSTSNPISIDVYTEDLNMIAPLYWGFHKVRDSK